MICLSCGFRVLDSMKGELERGLLTSPATPSPATEEESPVRNNTQVVRVRHMDQVHRFCMVKVTHAFGGKY